MHDTTLPPIARLVGVTHYEGDHSECSLVFELETEGGERVKMTYGTLMMALRFAQEQEIMPPLSVDWWARSEHWNGRLL